MSSNTVVLITGVNRGKPRKGSPRDISLASQPHRDRSSSESFSSNSQISPRSPQGSLQQAHHRTSETDAHAAVRELESAPHGITSLDLVVANAGILKGFPRVEAVRPSYMKEHYQVNVIAPILLFQATLPLLQMSKSTMTKFVAIGSSAGSIGGMEQRPFPNAAYGPTKASLNYLTRKTHLEHEDIIAFPVDPGWPRSDMGDFAAASFGLPQAEITVSDSVKGVVSVIDGATRENTSGRFLVHTGEECPW